jgi:2-oxoglutarate dehydrogenase E1 component
LKVDPLPLVILTPKSLLRRPAVMSSLKNLSQSIWQPVIDDPEVQSHFDKIKRVVLCSGKVYVDLVSSNLRSENDSVAIVRIEQLYPFPKTELKKVLLQYSGLEEVVWLQEEPKNMGAWTYMWPRLRGLLNDKLSLHYIGRRTYSSPAEGSPSRHNINQNTLIEQAFNLKCKKEVHDIICLINI